MTEQPRSAVLDDRLIAELLRRGYRIEIDPDGTERIIRPNGTVAITAKRP